MRRLIALRFLPLALLLIPAGAAECSASSECFEGEEGIAALRGLLRVAAHGDQSARLDARRRIKLALARHYRARTPPGMRFVPGRVQLSAESVSMVGGLYLAIHEVTEADCAQFRKERPEIKGVAPTAPGGPRPEAMTMVSLEAARAYAAWAGARLPTAEELAIASRGPAGHRYPWGERFEPWRVNSRESGCGAPRIPGTHCGGASFHGIEDLLGNVAEWTETTNGKDGERQRYLVVGGSYRSYLRRARFVTYRLRPEERQPDVGFRLARDLPPLAALAPPTGGS